MGANTVYEATQNYSWLTRYLHSTRYKELLKAVASLKCDIGNRKIRVLDIGCGPGSAVRPLIEAFDVEYLGIDYDPTFINAAREKYGHREDCRFIVGDASDRELYKSFDADIVIALETLEHIPANRAVRVIEHVCEIVKQRIFLVTVPVEVRPSVWIKNWGASLMGYDRQSGNARETLWAGLYRLDKVPPHCGSHQGIDWRWLAQTIRVNTPVKQIHSLPFSFLPKFLAPNVIIIPEPPKSASRKKVSEPWMINHKGRFGFSDFTLVTSLQQIADVLPC
jgi:SAM-dependent methyltransferase